MFTPTITAGRVLISLSAVATTLGPFIADFNETHVYNPKWPPHAKFHNGQTMSMGAGLGLLTLYYTWTSTTAPPETLTTAALLGSLYWFTGLSAILYPGAKGMDPEFGQGFPQFWVFTGLSTITWVGWWLESASLATTSKLSI